MTNAFWRARRPIGPCQRGFALLAVLALLVPISLLCVSFVWLARSDVRVVAASRGSAQAEAIANAVVFEAAFHLTDPNTPWPVDGQPITLARFGATVSLCIAGESHFEFA